MKVNNFKFYPRSRFFHKRRGSTGVYNAGVEIVSKSESLVYYALEDEGKLKLYTYAGSLLQDNTDTSEADMDRVAAETEAHNSKYYRIIGVKVFCDGVAEAHTAWSLDDYADRPGYKGATRFNDHENNGSRLFLNKT